jgi:PAS domain S-box-containing protein
MKDEGKTKEQLINELAGLRRRITELESSEIERERAEEALRESEARYRALVEQIPAVIYIAALDEISTTLYFSPQVETILGFPQAEWLAEPDLFCKQLHPDDRERVLTELTRSRASGEPFKSEYRLLTRDGGVVWFRDEAVMVRDEAGNPLFLQGVMLDITEHRQAEGALRESEARYRAIFEDQTELICRFLPDGTLTFVNEAYCRYFGKRQEELLGHSFMPLIPQEDQDFVKGQFASLNLENPVVTYEHQVVAPNGEIRWQQWIDRAIFDEQGRFVEFQSVGRDITERKQAEEALRRRVKQLTALNQASQTVTASLELEQVLNGIVSLAGEVTDSDYTSVVMVDEEGKPIRGVETVPKVPAIEQRVRAGGHTDWIIRSRRAVIVDDVAGDGTIISQVPEGAPRTLNPYMMKAGVRSFAGLPLTARDHLLGVLYLHSLRPGNFQNQLPLLTTFANQAAIAIENARLYRASQERLARLATLNLIGTTAALSLEPATVVHRILDLICQALGATEGSILMKAPDTGELVFALDLVEGARAMRGQRLAPGQGIAGWVTQHGQSVCANDVRQDPRFYDGVDSITGFQTHSLLCAPLKHRGEITGAIEIVNKRQGEFNDEDLSLLEAVSSIAATALENARLYKATQARADELALLNAIGLALTSTLDFSKVVHAALTQVQRLFRAENVSLLQPDPQTGELHFVRMLVGANSVEIPVCLQPEEGIAGWALEQRRPVLVEDAQNDPRFSDRVDKHLGSQTRALMAVPLLTPERASGVIEVVSSEPGAYTQDELHTLQALASTLAVALENARLYDELKTLLREREQAQAHLVHTEKMAALGRLIASLAHEINNPLQALHSCLGLLLNRSLAEEKQHRYLKVAAGEVERLIAIMRRLRDFYRTPAERREPIDFNAVLDEILALSGKQLQENRVTVRRELAADLPLVETVVGQLQQVFLNIILNALDAMPGGGELVVETGWDDDRREVWISFADTGEGIPAGEIPRIFEPFYTTRPEGTGLGLSVSYSIVERHGGRIEAASQVGAGSTFTIFLPTAGGGSEAESGGGS